jgi:hypothetical protein
MCSRTFTVVVDNNKQQKFNVHVGNFTSDSFLRLIRIALAISEIEDDCKFDDVVYDNWRNIDFNSIVNGQSCIHVYSKRQNVDQKIPEVPKTPDVKIRKLENPPELKRNKQEEQLQDVEEVQDEEYGEDDSYVERIFCHVCFGFDSTQENPIVLCDALGRTCDVGYHKNCRNIRNVCDSFYCDIHKKSSESRKRGRSSKNGIIPRKLF